MPFLRMRSHRAETRSSCCPKRHVHHLNIEGFTLNPQHMRHDARLSAAAEVDGDG